jgi:transcriptional regulator
MYAPDAFHVTEKAPLLEVMRDHPFALIVTGSDAGMVATSAPVVTLETPEGVVLRGHLARANPHWRAMDGKTDSLVVFSGPDGYVSPGWYEASPAVPTWNYASVHATGRLVARHDEEFVRSVMAELTARHEGNRDRPWRLEGLPGEFRERLYEAIVGFEMPVARLEGKFKLGQNRSVEDRLGVIEGLEREGRAEAAALAAFMKRHGFDGV